MTILGKRSSARISGPAFSFSSLPDATTAVVVGFLGHQDRIRVATVSKRLGPSVLHACMVASHDPHRESILLLSLPIPITEQQWETLAKQRGRRRRARDRLGPTWKATLRPRGCRSCGKTTTRHFFGECVCDACSRNPHNTWSFAVPKKVARQYLRRHGHPLKQVAVFPFHRSVLAHLIRYAALVAHTNSVDTAAERLLCSPIDGGG